MYCGRCGALNPDESNYCGGCGRPLRDPPGESKSGGVSPAVDRPPARTGVQPPPVPAVPPGHTRLAPPPAVRPYYAGFWKRFAAYCIDEIILAFAGVMIMLVVAAIVGIPMGVSGIDEDYIAPLILVYFGIIASLLDWLYHTVLESSSRQATLGKMAMGIVVTDMEGGRVSFGRANGRYWSKILSGLFFSIGYIMAGFTERKQALHDLIAATLVINR
ncbi:MAG TPA: hypothetical protein ENO08_00880 [Candidatus Eisenbacteria bacterium]|uniref:RDD family protein n=1 Tax=Eiseniibacteriota bacterium TaxID=2212470 RepID=A0A7V2ATJ0_UNCEI|nr:hypothetical protein [Candidatus Eisenbacteria bacterium]